MQPRKENLSKCNVYTRKLDGNDMILAIILMKQAAVTSQLVKIWQKSVFCLLGLGCGHIFT